ncbi:GGDEF domain-containing response regulator [Nostoc sp.]|uniref:GGDEF domain-containing response regulator n=1 Tax=Nostoc sp. TaxID=1180 RepID=UPI002FF91A6D
MSGISPFSVSKQPPLILLADHDKTIRVLLRKAMEQEGYRVVEVNDGKQCLDAYETIKPDIVLLDAVMPVMDGFTCCERLRQIAKNNLISALATFDTGSIVNNTVISQIWERTPILMITCLDDEESVNRAFDAGATDYVTKPIHLPVLRRRLRGLLQQAQVYKQLEAANQALHHLANIDGLTGLANYRRFDDYLNKQWINLVQAQAPLSLIWCDVDFFKFFNDHYDHLEGSKCLQRIGALFATQLELESQDLAAYYGGDKFVVILPYSDSERVIIVATEIQNKIRNLEIAHPKSKISQYVTLSIGVVTTVPTWESSPEILMKAGDQALYRAKQEGRNRIVFC